MRSVSRGLDVATALVVTGALVALVHSLEGCRTPGWDESGHAFAALRFAAAARDGAWHDLAREIVRTDYYPPLGRLGLSLGFLGGSSSFDAPRITTIAAFGVLLVATALLARKLVPAPLRAHASFVAVLCGATSWLATQHARVAFLEVWAGASLALGALGYLRASGRRTFASGALAGLAISAASLVKWTHGLQLANAVAVCALVTLWIERHDRAARARMLRMGAGLAIAASLPLAWWFVLPWPGGLALGAEHRAAYVEYLVKASALEGLRVVDLAIVFGGMACLSPPSALLQIGGLARGVARSARDVVRASGEVEGLGDRSPREGREALAAEREATRLVALIALAGLGTFVVYPYRIERFLVPTSFAAWALGGACGAALVAHASAVEWKRAAWLAAGSIVLVSTRGVGSVALIHAVRGRGASTEQLAALTANARLWRAPFAPIGGPATGPEGVEHVLEFAARHVDGRAPFGWIGGTCTDIPTTLVRWRLFRERPERASLAWDPEPIDALWSDPGFDEPAFAAWAGRFDTLVVLDPPDPRERKARSFERRFVGWTSDLDGFERVALERVSFGRTREHEISAWRRIRAISSAGSAAGDELEAR